MTFEKFRDAAYFMREKQDITRMPDNEQFLASLENSPVLRDRKLYRRFERLEDLQAQAAGEVKGIIEQLEERARELDTE